MASGLKRLPHSPLFLAIGSVIVILAVLVGRADMVLFGPTPSLWATVSRVPLFGRGILHHGLLAPSGTVAPVLLRVMEYPAAYVIRVRNQAGVVADNVGLTLPDADFAYRESRGVLDSLQRASGRFQVGAVVPGEEVVLWVFGRTMSEQDHSSLVRVYKGGSAVPTTSYAPFRSAALFVVLHLSQIVIGLIVIEGLAIGGVSQLLRWLRGEPGRPLTPAA